MTSVFVTGAGGVLGRAICRQLVERGARVVAHDLPGRCVKLDERRVEHVSGDILDSSGISRAIAEAGCEYVVHLAAIVASYANLRPREAVHANVAGAANVCEAARAASCRGIVYVSSRSVYGNVGKAYAHPHYRRVPESHPCNPSAMYPATKRAAEMVIERYATDFGVPAVVLRFGAIYGPGKSNNHGATRAFSEAIEAAALGKPYRIGGADQREDFIYSEDIPGAILAALQLLQDSGSTPGAQVFNIGSGIGVSIKEFGEMLERISGSTIEMISGTGVVGRDYRQSFVMSDRKARRVLRYRPRFDLEAGIRHFVNELRQKVTA